MMALSTAGNIQMSIRSMLVRDCRQQSKHSGKNKPSDAPELHLLQADVTKNSSRNTPAKIPAVNFLETASQCFKDPK